MHEAALCQSLVDIINDQQRERGFDRVHRVVVELGAMGHVEPRALEFAFTAVAKNSPAEGALLEIIEIEGRGRCLSCAADVSISHRGDPCPQCGEFGMILQQGDELRLKELEVV